MMCGVQTRTAADIARELDIHWLVHRIVCVHTGCQRIPKLMTQLIVWDCMGLSFIHWTCFTDQKRAVLDLKHG